MKKILIVDDSRVIRSMVSRTLDGLYEVHTADDGAQGLEKTLSNKYDLVITDINMPVIDGLEMSKQIRGGTDNPNRSVNLIILTTETNQQKKDIARQHGVHGWMVKPFSPETLKKIAQQFTA